MKINSKTLALIFLTILAFIFRIWKINSVPPSLNWDEVSHAYNAYSILKTGQDEWGNALPLIFRAFGDYKLPLYIYLTTLPVALFGLTTLSTRIISIIAGTLAVPGIYLLLNQLMPRKLKLHFRSTIVTITSGEIAAFLLAISPWHFFISRPALEANLGLTLFIYAIYFLFKGLKNSRFFIYSSVLFSLTLFTYNSYRVVTPLILISFGLIYFKQLKKLLLTKPAQLAIAIYIISMSFVVYQTLNGVGAARYQKLAIINENSTYTIEEQRNQSELPAPLPKLLYNRPLYFVKESAKNYLSYFSLDFLYQTRDSQTQFAIPGKNLLSLPTTLMLLAGLPIIIKKLKNKQSPQHRFLVSLLLISPLAAAITNSPPQALRPSPMLLPLVLIAALGFFWVAELIQGHLKSALISTSLIVYVLFSLTLASSRYATAYFKSYPLDYPESWQYGYEQVVDYVVEHQDEYDQVIFTKDRGEAHIFYAFYSQLDPNVLQPGGNSYRFEQSDWFWTDRIGKVYFANAWDIPSYGDAQFIPLESGPVLTTRNSLLITTPSHLPTNVEILELIYYPESRNIAFIIAKF